MRLYSAQFELDRHALARTLRVSTSPSVSSSPSRSLSIPPCDPPSADVIYELSQQLATLERAHEKLLRDADEAKSKHAEEMKPVKEEAHHERREIRRAAREKIAHLDSLNKCTA